jgi:hypothetical protein
MRPHVLRLKLSRGTTQRGSGAAQLGSGAARVEQADQPTFGIPACAFFTASSGYS